MLSDEWLPRYRLLENFTANWNGNGNGNAYDRGDYNSSFALRAVELTKSFLFIGDKKGNGVEEVKNLSNTTVMILNFRKDRSWQTLQTLIRLLLEEQSDQGLHCLLFNFHRVNEIPFKFGLFVRILCRLQQRFPASQNLGTIRYII